MGENLVASVLVVPLGERGRHLHFFSIMLRQPTPVLYAQTEISPCFLALGMMHCSVPLELVIEPATRIFGSSREHFAVAIYYPPLL
jgi:hypothetical protein